MVNGRDTALDFSLAAAGWFVAVMCSPKVLGVLVFLLMVARLIVIAPDVLDKSYELIRRAKRAWRRF